MPSGPEQNNMITHAAFMAYVADDASHDAVRVFSEKAGFPSSVVQPGGLDVLTTVVTEATKLPKVILVDIDGTSEPLPTITRLIEALEGISRIIAVGSANDVKLFRSLLAAGAADYVVKPLTVELLQTAYDNASKLQAGSTTEPSSTHIVPIIGVRGGVGTTTIAVNLSWILAHKLNYTTALLDLDLQYGTSTLALDLTPGHGLREALETPGRLDSLLIASSMANESDMFSILGAEEPVEDIIHYENNAVGAITSELRSNFTYILVDLPRHLLAQQRALLGESETIILVAEQTLAAVRDIVRLKAALKTLAPQARILVIVSRVAGGKSHERLAQLDQPHFEKGIQDKIAALIPEDPQPVATAANRGQAIGKVAPNAPSTLALQRLAEILTGHKPHTGNQAIWSRLAKKFKKNRANKASVAAER